MVKNEIIMRYIFIIVFLVFHCSLSAQDYSWKADAMDGSRRESINKATIKKSSSTAKVIAIVEEAQPKMARVKEIVGSSKFGMEKGYPQSSLSNWTVDVIMQKVAELSSKKVDVGISNFGGIRLDMPKGDILLDDIQSMFPFKNNLIYLEHKGSTIRALVEWMASTRFQPFGGMQVTVENGIVTSILIDGKPLEDDKVYSMATNSFLLNGGDGFFLSKEALNMVVYDSYMFDAILETVREATAEGRQIDYECDSRIEIK